MQIKEREMKDRLAELFGQLRRYRAIGFWCGTCGSEIWIADHTFHQCLVSVRCQCRMQFIERHQLPQTQREWVEFWEPWPKG